MNHTLGSMNIVNKFHDNLAIHLYNVRPVCWADGQTDIVTFEPNWDEYLSVVRKTYMALIRTDLCRSSNESAT